LRAWFPDTPKGRRRTVSVQVPLVLLRAMPEVSHRDRRARLPMNDNAAIYK